jgi:D-aspartate ligase
MKENFVGIILGGDMNSYAVARAFYEAYGIKTIVLGRFPLYPTNYSKIIEAYYNNDLLDEKVMLEELKKIDEKYPDKIKIVLSFKK